MKMRNFGLITIIFSIVCTHESANGTAECRGAFCRVHFEPIVIRTYNTTFAISDIGWKYDCAKFLPYSKHSTYARATR